MGIADFAQSIAAGITEGVADARTPSADAIAQVNNQSGNGSATSAPADAKGILHGIDASHPGTILIALAIGVGVWIVWKGLK